MCWFSAHDAARILQAQAGQPLVNRKVHGRSWVLQESDLDTPRPTPVCLVDRTRVLFRFSDLEPARFALAPETEAVFHMSTNPQRDVFQLSDGREADVNTLPVNLRLDVL
jgi:hypothetical protein